MNAAIGAANLAQTIPDPVARPTDGSAHAQPDELHVKGRPLDHVRSEKRKEHPTGRRPPLHPHTDPTQEAPADVRQEANGPQHPPQALAMKRGLVKTCSPGTNEVKSARATQLA